MRRKTVLVFIKETVTLIYRNCEYRNCFFLLYIEKVRSIGYDYVETREVTLNNIRRLYIRDDRYYLRLYHQSEQEQKIRKKNEIRKLN